MAGNFADRLMAAIEEKNSRVCVGIDPVPERFPPEFQPSDGDWREDAVLTATRTFCWSIIGAVSDKAAAVKFNSAFFERLSPEGTRLLDDLLFTMENVHPDLLAIVDAKRGDIGSTATAYALGLFREYYGYSPGVPHAVTVNPYLGTDGFTPFLEEVRRLDRGVFVLVKTSNPSARELQDLEAEGKPIYVHVAELVNRWGEDMIGDRGYSSVGAVVGATYPEQLRELRQVMPHTPFLVPGFGAQGGGAEDVVGAFDEDGLGAIVNSSRGIIYAYAASPYASRFDASRFDEAAAQAAEDMRVAINEALGL